MPMLTELQADSIEGKIVEIFGLPDSGKTNLALSFSVFFQQRGCIVYYVDADCKISTKHLKNYPEMDIEKFYIQKGFAGIDQIISNAALADVIVIDSIPMTLKQKGLLRMLRSLKRLGKTIIAVNQIRSNFEKSGTTRPFFNDISQKIYDIRINLSEQTYEDIPREPNKPFFTILDKLKKEELF